MRLASFSDYSLRVLIYLAVKDKELSTVGEISKKYNISRNHLVKVVHNLATMGVINSYKGKGGGIALSLSPDKINIGKLVRKLEMDSTLVECFGNSNQCIITSSCKLKNAIKAAEQSFYETLSTYTLEDIVSNKNKLAESLSL